MIKLSGSEWAGTLEPSSPKEQGSPVGGGVGPVMVRPRAFPSRVPPAPWPLSLGEAWRPDFR